MLIIAMLIGMLPSNLIVVKADETQMAKVIGKRSIIIIRNILIRL